MRKKQRQREIRLVHWGSRRDSYPWCASSGAQSVVKKPEPLSREQGEENTLSCKRDKHPSL